jgi:hypothetical protein
MSHWAHPPSHGTEWPSDCRLTSTRSQRFAMPAAVRFASVCGADRIELYTEPFARSFGQDDERAKQSFLIYARAAHLAHELGLALVSDYLAVLCGDTN